MLRLRWLPSRRLPIRTLRDCPIPIAVIYPIRTGNKLLLGSDERIHRTHPILLLWASTDSGKRCYTIVDDDTNLLAGDGIAG